MISSMAYTYVVYFSYMGVCFLYTNEIAESFNVAVGLVMFWMIRCILAKVIPIQIKTLPLYWIPGFMAITGMGLFIVMRPLIVETRGNSLSKIAQNYSEFKYSIFQLG